MQPPRMLVVFRSVTNDKIMRKAVFLVTIVAVSLTALAQEREYQTVFDNQDLRISGLGGPFMQFTAVAGEFGHMMGLIDEYEDSRCPNRATATSPGVKTDNSIMGDYRKEGKTTATIKPRHVTELAERIGKKMGLKLEAG